MSFPSRFHVVFALAMAAWAALVVAATWGLLSVRGKVTPTDVIVAVPLALGIATVWFGGLRAYLFFASRRILARSRARSVPAASETRARVALLYCTADDLNVDALRRSAGQTHDDVTVVILDDSKTIDSRAAVDVAADEIGATVVRRVGRTGFKAGNLNNFLRTCERFDYYAILDSDEIVQSDFVARALDHFAADAVARAEAMVDGHRSGDPVGVVQGGHIAHRGDSAFTEAFAPMLGTHVATTQLARSAVGFSMFMGRGALLSDEVVRATGGFPEVVAEDVAFTIQARDAGFRVEFAPDIVSTEDFPVDYHAFKKQHGKMVQGTTELIRRFAPQVLRSRMAASEKLDILVELIMVPLGSLLGVALFIASLVTFAARVPLLPMWMGVALGLSGLAPLLPEALRRTSTTRPSAGLIFLGRAFALYSSMFWVTLRSVVRVLVGRRAVFVITPKRRSASGWRATLLADLIVAVVALSVSVFFTGSIAPAMTATAAAAAAAYLTRFSAGRRPGIAAEVSTH